ncbi:MAG TPA: hypothetical protein VFR54_14565 [Xanthobacteraceae bacterium]|nr:hypothetical protein [Xanthobacteraceae bacterium]
MRYLVFALAFVCAAAAPTRAQDAIPDLKGTWSGKGKSIVFGSHEHHPGSQTAADPPRVRDIQATHTVEGQDGRLAWGRSSSATADTKEPFAWAIASDNKTIVGADVDGYFRITLIGPDRMEKCYCPQRHEPEPIDRRDLLHDGPCETISRALVTVARCGARTRGDSAGNSPAFRSFRNDEDWPQLISIARSASNASSSK